MQINKNINLKLPNFLCVGTGRSGTTWLYSILRRHPDIFLSTPKETRFFYDDFYYFTKGVKWYSNFFRNTNKQLIGEITPLYIHRKVPERINKILDNPKIILMVRNPIDRLYSSYKLLIWGYGYNYSFNYFLKQLLGNYPSLNCLFKPIIVEELYYGKYFEILTSYLSLFPKENIKVVFFEDIKNDPENILKEVLRFLGAKDSFRLRKNLHKPVWQSPSIMPRSIIGLILKFVFTLTHILFCDYHRRRRARWLISYLSYRISKIIPFLYKPFPKLDTETRKEVYSYYKDDIEKFSKLVNRDLSHWK